MVVGLSIGSGVLTRRSLAEETLEALGDLELPPESTLLLADSDLLLSLGDDWLCLSSVVESVDVMLLFDGLSRECSVVL